MADLDRVEFWSDLDADGGTRLAIVKNLLACRETVTLDGEDTLELGMQRDNPALVTIGTAPGSTNAEPSRVARCVMADGSVIDRRITQITERDTQGETRAEVRARGMMHELSLRGMIARTSDATGVRLLNFEVVGLTPSQHLATYVLPALTEAGQPFWEAGTVHADTPITVVYDRDTPIGGLRKIASATSAGLEVAVRYDQPRKKFLIDLVRQIGASAPSVRVHAGSNLIELAFSRSVEDVVTRIAAFGGADDELGVATMGRNAWFLDQAHMSGGQNNIWTLQLTDPAGGAGPVAITGQYDPDDQGKYWLIPVGGAPLTAFQILTSDGTTGAVTALRVDAGLGLPGSRGALYQIARDWHDQLPHGTRTREMIYVQDPVSVAEHGVRIGYVDRPDLAGVLNLMQNPLARVWGDGSVGKPLGVPVGWTLLNTTGVKDTSEWRSGGASLKIVLLSSDATVTIIDYFTPLSAGLVSFFADVKATSAPIAVKLSVTLKTITTLPDGSTALTITYPDDLKRLTPSLAYVPTLETRQPGTWERIGMDAAHDAAKYPISAMRVVVRTGLGPGGNSLGSATGWLDAVQATNTATQRELVEGSGANALIHAANSSLVRYAGLARSLDVNVLDLTTLDGTRYPYDEYVLGGRVVVRDERLARTVSIRVLGWTRDWKNKAMLQVQISNAGQVIESALAQRPVSARPAQSVGGLR